MPSGVLHLKEVDTDKITLDGTLSVSGESTLKEASVLESTVSVGGTATFAAPIEATNVNVSGTLSVAGQTTIAGDIIPDTNDAYDIGSPEFKIRDMYVSDNSLWIGDTAKISNVGGRLKFRKRKINQVPRAIIDAGHAAGHANAQATTDAALAHAGVGHLTQMRLQHWHKFMRTMNRTAKLTDIFREDDDDYEATSASDAWKEIAGADKIYTSDMVGVGTSDPDATLHVQGSLKVESEEGGFQLIRSTAGGNDPQLIIDTRHFGVDDTIEDLTGQGCNKFTKLYRVFGTNSEGLGRHWYWGLANDDYTNISLAVGGESGGNDPDLAFTFTTTSELYCNKVFAALGGNADTATLAAAATRLETPRKINGVNFDGTQDITLSSEASKLATPVNINGVPFDGSGDININEFHGGRPIKKLTPDSSPGTYSYVLNAPRPGTSTGGAVHFINGAGRSDDGGASTYTIRNDSGTLVLGNSNQTTRIVGNVEFETPPSSSTSATRLATSRTINGVGFDGTSNIDLGLANSAKIEATTADTANKIALRNNQGDIFARLFRSDYQNQDTCTGAIAFRTSTTDNYIRFCSDMGAVRSRIGCANLAGAGGQNFSANNIYIGNSTSRGLRSVSGNYGTVQTTGEGAGNWEGYSINGRYVFMSDSNDRCGIFNDLDNEWMAYFVRNGASHFYHNGADKLQTRSDGVNVSGDLLVGRVGFGNDIGKRIETGGCEHGTVTTQGSRRSWGGYAIQNQWVLMAHKNGDYCGIYNDQDNQWGMECHRKSYTYVHYKGGWKFRTEDWGVRVNGRIHQDGYGYIDDKINAKLQNNNNYNIHGSWLRENGDNSHFKMYGNSRQMVFRTDGTSEYSSRQIGNYPFAYMYGNDKSGNRKMLINTNGNIWTPSYSWLNYLEKSDLNGIASVLRWRRYSDDRIKFNEEPITNPLELIKKLKPQKYEKIVKVPPGPVGEWIPKDDEWEQKKKDLEHEDEYGFIAQDVKQIPEFEFLVNGQESEMREKSVSFEQYSTLSEADKTTYSLKYTKLDEQGGSDITKTEYEYSRLDDDDKDEYEAGYVKQVQTETPLTLNYSDLFVVAVGALQELSAKTRTLETQLVQLLELERELDMN